MDPTAQRLFLFFDEWLFIALCLYLLHRWTAGMLYAREEVVWKWAVRIAIPVGALMVYGISYPIFFGWMKP